MNLYISDIHFGHRAVIGFDHRPFADCEEMEHVMIKLWNERVQKDDDVYIVGDFCYRSDKEPEYYLRKLRGNKHLIIGNHDEELLKNKKAMSYFKTVEERLQIEDKYLGKSIQVCLQHYPIEDWSSYFKDSWHVYGHIHNKKNETYEIMKNRKNCLNAGCMINNYTPVSFRELVDNNIRFQKGNGGRLR